MNEHDKGGGVRRLAFVGRGAFCSGCSLVDESSYREDHRQGNAYARGDKHNVVDGRWVDEIRRDARWW